MPQSIKRTSLILASLMAPLSLIACASSSGVDSFDKAEVNSTSLSSYQSVYVADVKVSDELKSRTKIRYQSRASINEPRPISERDLNRKAKDLKKALKRELGKNRNVVSSPGADVLTVQATLTDLQSNRPTQADLSANVGLSFQSIYAGKASATFVLSNQGQELARLKDTYNGDLLEPRPIGVWEDVDRTFNRWSRNIASAINNG